MKKSIVLGAEYAFIHFSVETACFYFLFSRMSASPLWWAWALLFDAVAFIPQGFFGMLTDQKPRLNVGLIGSICVLTALVIKPDVLSLVVIGIGNALIHISGAQYTLRGTGGKAAPGGIFVGGGSFGVITGQLLGAMQNEALLFVPLVLMVVSGVLMYLIPHRTEIHQKFAEFDIAADRGTALIVVLSFVAVAVRGYIGYAIPTEWNKTVPQAIALFCSMGIGKMLGGILSDCIGFKKTTYISLLGGLPFLLFGNTNMALSLIGIALFSMTMPITAAILASEFPKMPGFAFGITTVALFAGILPAFFVQPETLFAHQAVVVMLTVIALPAISICIKRGR